MHLLLFSGYVMAKQSLVHQALLSTCPIYLARIQKHSFLLLWPKRTLLTLIRMDAHVGLGLSVHIRKILSHSTVYYDKKSILVKPRSQKFKFTVHSPWSYPKHFLIRLQVMRSVYVYHYLDYMYIVVVTLCISFIWTDCSKYR